MDSLISLLQSSLSGDRVILVRQMAKYARELEARGDSEVAGEIRGLLADRDASIGLQKASADGDVRALRRREVSGREFADTILPDSNQPSKAILSQYLSEKLDEFCRFYEKSELLNNHGLGIPSTLLFYGPPGCGKSLAAKTVAKRLRLPLYIARADALVSSHLGATSKNIRSLFDSCSIEPCVLFLDEFDALAKARDDAHELGELKRVVVALLQNIDSLPSTTVVVAATNHHSLLDSAVWRRFSYKMLFDLPGEVERTHMYRELLNAYEVDEQLFTELAYLSEGLSFSDIEQLVKRALRKSLVESSLAGIVKNIIYSIYDEKSDSNADPSESDLIRWMRSLDRPMTMRQLAQVFEMSASKISRIVS